MNIIAATSTDKTKELLQDMVNGTKGFADLRRDSGLNLNSNTILIRLALINLKKNFPSNKEVLKYKDALRSPKEFDKYLERIKSDL